MALFLYNSLQQVLAQNLFNLIGYSAEEDYPNA